MADKIENLAIFNNEILLNDFKKKLEENQQLCLIYIASSHIKKDSSGWFYIVIKWMDHFKSNFIKYNLDNFTNDIWTFLSRKKIDLSFKKEKRYFSYKISSFNKEEEAFNYYSECLEIAFNSIKDSSIYKLNSSIFIEEFLFAFFILRGSYDNDTFEYLTGIFKNSFFDKEIPCKFFFSFYSKGIVEILNLYNFPNVLKFIYIKKSNEIHFRVKAIFLSENINSFKNNKLNLNLSNNNKKLEFPNNINHYVKSALNRRNKYNKILNEQENIQHNLIEKSSSKTEKNSKEINEDDKDFLNDMYIKENDNKGTISVWQRDTAAIRKIKNYFFKYNIKGCCEICNFSFKDILNREYIEMHHIVPRNKRSIEKKYKNLKEVKRDFVFLCSNCHKLADNIENIDDREEFYIKYKNLLKNRD